MNPELLEPLLGLGFVIARLDRLQGREVRPIRDNPIAGLVLAGVILDLALVVDAVMHPKLAGAAKKAMKRKGEPSLGQLISAYSTSRGLTLRGTDVRDLATAFSAKFDETLLGLLGGRPVLGRPSPIPPEEADFAITLGVRNHSAHRLSRSLARLAVRSLDYAAVLRTIRGD